MLYGFQIRIMWLVTPMKVIVQENNPRDYSCPNVTRDMLSRRGINRKRLCLEENRVPKDISDVVLYRYMPWDAFEKTISSWSLKATLASDTNDFFEYFPATSDDPEIDEYAKELTRGNKVFISFSSLMSSCAMWGHYAKHYNGVCMVFYFPKKLFDTRSILCEVAYQKERVLVGEVASPEDAAEKLNVLLTTKDISWSFEHETRLFYEAEDASEARDGMLLYRDPMKYFAGVILGTRCSASIGYVKAMIKQSPKRGRMMSPIFNNLDVAVTRSHAHPTEFLIESEFWENDMTGKKLRNKGYIF